MYLFSVVCCFSPPKKNKHAHIHTPHNLCTFSCTNLCISMIIIIIFCFCLTFIYLHHTIELKCLWNEEELHQLYALSRWVSISISVRLLMHKKVYLFGWWSRSKKMVNSIRSRWICMYHVNWLFCYTKNAWITLKDMKWPYKLDTYLQLYTNLFALLMNRCTKWSK